MKRLFTAVCTFILLHVFVFSNPGECRSEKSLYYRLNEQKVVKTYVSDITDSSGKAKADLNSLKKEIENALATRMTINFKLVSEADADVIINCDITEFLWMEKDPIDHIYGIIDIALDAAADDHYARMQAVFSIMDTKTKNVLWREKIQATITDKTMTPNDSIAMVNDRMVQVFMRKAFSKPSKPRI